MLFSLVNLSPLGQAKRGAIRLNGCLVSGQEGYVMRSAQ